MDAPASNPPPNVTRDPGPNNDDIRRHDNMVQYLMARSRGSSSP